MIELGFCDKAHGIKGGFHFKLYEVENSSLKPGIEILLKTNTDKELGQFSISKIQFGNKVICYLEGIDNRNQVEELLPFKIYILEKDLIPLNEGEFYLKDIIGCKVFCAETKLEIGSIIGFYETNIQTVIEMEIDGKKMDLPFVDEFFKEKDIANKRVSIKRPEFIE